jgi:peptide chain release factor 1
MTTSQEYTDLKPAAEKVNELAFIEKNIVATEELLKIESDEEMKLIAEQELQELRSKQTALETELAELTRPQDPLDKKDVIIEIRAGGGAELRDCHYVCA